MICAIVLAAGKSRRMGAQKLLLPVAGRPMIVHIVSEVLKVELDGVLVVTGTESQSVRESLAGLPVTVITNTAPDGDMLSSIRCGWKALPASCSSVFIVPGDQPGITPGLIVEMVKTQKRSQKPIVTPVCQGRHGHPVLLSAGFRDEILHHYDGTGLRGLLHAHETDIAEVAVDDPGILQDVDLPEDYARLIGNSL